MTDISRKQMVEWLRMQKFTHSHGNNYLETQHNEMIDSIIAALEPKISRELIEKWLEKNAPLCTCDEAYTGRGLTAPDCLRHRGLDAEDLIRMLKELGLAALAGPSEEEKEEMLLHWDAFNVWMRHKKPHAGPCSVCNKIRNLILGNQGGAVSPDTRVSPRGETSVAVTDKWERDRLWRSALVHVLSVEDVTKVTGYFNSIRPDREAGAAGKEKP